MLERDIVLGELRDLFVFWGGVFPAELGEFFVVEGVGIVDGEGGFEVYVFKAVWFHFGAGGKREFAEIDVAIVSEGNAGGTFLCHAAWRGR